MYNDLGVVLNENRLLNTIKREIGDLMFDKFDMNYYYEIIHNVSLYFYSQYYPKVSPPILLTNEKHGIKSENPFTGEVCIYKYEVPNFNPREIQYVGVQRAYFPQNDCRHFTAMGNSTIGSLLHKLTSNMPHMDERYIATFEFPGIVVVEPIPTIEEITSFTVKMKIKRKLNQIEFGYHDDFTNLVLCDVKLAILKKFPNLRDSGIYSGVEVNTRISDFEAAESKREALVEIFESDWYKANIDYGDYLI